MSAVPPKPSKRLCVFSDGTWSTPEMETQTNICTLATAVKHLGNDGVPQIVYYDPGVGSEGGLADQLKGGAFGEGIDLNIQQLYTFLAMNYEEGDEILLFGYSRGAYTVRSLAGLMNESGLVYRHKLCFVKEAYDLYRDNKDINSEVAQKFRSEHSRRVPIKLLLCFDTVGSLGLPMDPPLGLGFLTDHDRYRFHDTTLSESIEHAIHPLSIDEDRRSFMPTLMTPHPKRGADQVMQRFMPGHHGGIGGGNRQEKTLADNALMFAVEEIQKCVPSFALDMELLPSEWNRSVPARSKDPFAYKIIRAITGRFVRKIESVDMLHSSVFTRYRNVRDWRPDALAKFRGQLEA